MMAPFSFVEQPGGTLRLAATDIGSGSGGNDGGATSANLCLGMGKPADAAKVTPMGSDTIPPQLSLVACNDDQAKGWSAVPC